MLLKLLIDYIRVRANLDSFAFCFRVYDGAGDDEVGGDRGNDASVDCNNYASVDFVFSLRQPHEDETSIAGARNLPYD